MSNVQTKKHSIIKFAFAMSALMMSAACLPELDTTGSQDSGRDTSTGDGGGGDGGLIDAETDTAETGCPATPEDCVGVVAGPQCGIGNTRYTCVTDTNGCVSRREDDTCPQGEYCDVGECVMCPVVPECQTPGQKICDTNGDPSVCEPDENGCLALMPKATCSVGEFCELGECTPCGDLDASCDDLDSLRCVEPNTAPGVERCVMSNGCQIFELSPMDSCPSGQLCDRVGGCESCHDLECETVNDGEVLGCGASLGPRSYNVCASDTNGCRISEPRDCAEGSYCVEGGNDPCALCSDLATTCSALGETRCTRGGNLETCASDPGTGCLLWQTSEVCADAGPNGGVCLNQGEVEDPASGATASENKCVANECGSTDTESCSSSDEILICAEASSGLKYLRVKDTCSDRQTCGNALNGTSRKECICNHECEMGDTICAPGNGALEHSKVTQVCDDSRPDSCRVFVTDTSNKCNLRAIPTNGGVACDANLGDDSVFRCVEGGDSCRTPVSELCPCTGTTLCFRSECTEAQTTFSNGDLRYICE